MIGAALLPLLICGPKPQIADDPSQLDLVVPVPERAALAKLNVPYKRAGTILSANWFYPAHKKGRFPLVVFLNGVGNGAGTPLKDWRAYREWCILMASRGLAATCFDTRSGHVKQDIADFFRYLHANAERLRIDDRRIGLWACSANVTAAMPFAFSSTEPRFRCAAFYYGYGRISHVPSDLPVMLACAAKDAPTTVAALHALAGKAFEADAPWTVIEGRGLHHAFDLVDDSEGSRAVIEQTLAFFASNLASQSLHFDPHKEERAAFRYWYAHDFANAAAAFARLAKKNPQDKHLLEWYSRSAARVSGAKVEKE